MIIGELGPLAIIFIYQHQKSLERERKMSTPDTDRTPLIPHENNQGEKIETNVSYIAETPGGCYMFGLTRRSKQLTADLKPNLTFLVPKQKQLIE